MYSRYMDNLSTNCPHAYSGSTRQTSNDSGKGTHLGGDANEEHPPFVGVDAIVDNLVPAQASVAVKDLDRL